MLHAHVRLGLGPACLPALLGLGKYLGIQQALFVLPSPLPNKSERGQRSGVCLAPFVTNNKQWTMKFLTMTKNKQGMANDCCTIGGSMDGVVVDVGFLLDDALVFG